MNMVIASFALSEPAGVPVEEESVFFLHDSTSEFASLFRVLAGTCVITSLSRDVSVGQIKNYFFSDFRENPARNLSFLDAFEEGLLLADYEAHVRLRRFSHRKFYKNLLSEICGAIFNLEVCNHTAAFIHLYRAYEHISYAFPMIYAAKTDDYLGTFDSLRKWMTSSDKIGNTGELPFHKAFISTLFKDLPEISTTVDIHIICKEEYQDKVFEALAVKVLGWSDARRYTAETSRPDKLSINFAEFHSFIVNLRNRYFHYSSARSDNLALDEIADSELLFSLVNKAGLYYVATIFNRIVIHQAEA